MQNDICDYSHYHTLIFSLENGIFDMVILNIVLAFHDLSLLHEVFNLYNSTISNM